jgi:hypothetical protein
VDPISRRIVIAIVKHHTRNDLPIPPGWSGDRAGLHWDGLLISFQRYACPADGIILEVPTSLGALPVGVGAGGFLLPLAQAEAFWIGVTGTAPANSWPLAIAGVDRTGVTLPIASITSRADAFLPGYPRPDGSWGALSRDACSMVLIEVGQTNAITCATVGLVSPPQYAALTGQPEPPPLDPSAGYGGWRLE